MDEVMVFGSQLKRLREGKHLTQVELAKRLGIKKSLVSSYENGTRFPRYKVLIQTARFFNVSVDELCGMSERRALDVTGLPEPLIALMSMLIDYVKSTKDLQ